MANTFVPLAINVAFMYGLFVGLGGVSGYYQAGSVASLYGGLTGGSLAMLAFALCKRGKIEMGLKVLTGVALLLVVVFTRRFQATGAFLPAGFMGVNSAGVAMLSVLALKELAATKTTTSNVSKSRKSE